MRKIEHPTWVELASWLFCAFLSRGLLHDWSSFPLLDWSFTAFAIWILPVFIYWLAPHKNKKERNANPILLGLGVLFSLLGLLGELNVLKHSGLALASVGLLPWSKIQIFWLATAVAWFPAAAYLLRSFSFDFMIPLRLGAVTLGAACSVWTLFYRENDDNDHQTN